MQIAESILKASLTAQEVFDHTIRTVAGMSQRCETRGGYCSYRDDTNQSACVVGSMMTDEEVSDPLTGGILAGDVFNIRSRLPQRLAPHLTLLGGLQSIHDDASNWQLIGEEGRKGPPDAKRMRRGFLYVAEFYGPAEGVSLDTTVLDEIFPEVPVPQDETVAA